MFVDVVSFGIGLTVRRDKEREWKNERNLECEEDRYTCTVQSIRVYYQLESMRLCSSSMLCSTFKRYSKENYYCKE